MKNSPGKIGTRAIKISQTRKRERGERKRVDTSTKSFRIFSFLVSGTFGSLLQVTSSEFEFPPPPRDSARKMKLRWSVVWVLPPYMSDGIRKWMKDEARVRGEAMRKRFDSCER